MMGEGSGLYSERSKGKRREDDIFQDQGHTEASCGAKRSRRIRCNTCSHAQILANRKGSLGNQRRPLSCTIVACVCTGECVLLVF